MDDLLPHPANVPGDFYVEEGCCLACEVPITTAPDLFGEMTDEPAGYHCFVKKQPQTADEFARMLMVIRLAEATCIRYCGKNRSIQEFLVEIAEGPACVDLPDDLRKRSDQILARLEPRARSFLSRARRLLEMMWESRRGLRP